MTAVDCFRALGDPTRLELVERLATRGTVRVTDLTAGFSHSRQAVRKHLETLAGAGVVKLEPRGREVLATLEINALDEAGRYIQSLERRWDARLAALKSLVESGEGSP